MEFYQYSNLTINKIIKNNKIQYLGSLKNNGYSNDISHEFYSNDMWLKLGNKL